AGAPGARRYAQTPPETHRLRRGRRACRPDWRSRTRSAKTVAPVRPKRFLSPRGRRVRDRDRSDSRRWLCPQPRPPPAIVPDVAQICPSRPPAALALCRSHHRCAQEADHVETLVDGDDQRGWRVLSALDFAQPYFDQTAIIDQQVRDRDDTTDHDCAPYARPPPDPDESRDEGRGVGGYVGKQRFARARLAQAAALVNRLPLGLHQNVTCQVRGEQSKQYCRPAGRPIRRGAHAALMP